MWELDGDDLSTLPVWDRFLRADSLLDLRMGELLALLRRPPLDFSNKNSSFLWKYGFDPKSPADIDCSAGTERSGGIHLNDVRCDVATLVAKMLLMIEQELNGRTAMNNFCQTVIDKA